MIAVMRASLREFNAALELSRLIDGLHGFSEGCDSLRGSPATGATTRFISAGLSNLLLMGLLVGIIVNTQRAWPRPALARKRRAMKEVVGT